MRLIIDTHFKVKMRTCRVTCRASIGNNRALTYPLAFRYIQRFIMGVEGRHTIPMVDNNHITIARNPSCIDNGTPISCMDWFPIISSDINTIMEDITAINWVVTPPKTRGNFMARYRPRKGSRSLYPVITATATSCRLGELVGRLLPIPEFFR